ncbi:UDP-glycosyltransferase UGT5-like [Leptidea sinapis]|uniref:UDP-glycosyltransferase UGT5-like n=1 Tax=Leptidea sinapis TaxID=189913 RepID=UPI0021C4942C|nr:UDP-glycosyltransferase UGT5-like [Leptidea sinapis]
MYKLLIMTIIIGRISASRILAVIPTPSISHQVVFRPLVQELARRGHEVNVITPDPVFTSSKFENLTEIDVHDVSYDIWTEKYIDHHEFGAKDFVLNNVYNLLDVHLRLIEVQLLSKGVQDIINNKNIKFDLIILEAVSRPSLIFSHLYKVPVIQISSFGMMLGSGDIVGAPIHPLLYPIALSQRIYQRSFLEEIYESYKYWKVMKAYYNFEKQEHNILQRIIENDLPNYDVLRNNIEMLFLNMHPIWVDNQPIPENVITIWGIYEKPMHDLPQDLQDYLDSSKNGVIYLSFGCNAQSSKLPRDKIQMFIRVFSNLPYDILWKWETDELPGKPPNIKISKWLPQSDLLYHPSVKLFITQGGLQSTEEAINAGVPVIGIPMFADQWYNVEKYVHHKIGLRLDFKTLDKEKLKTAIDIVLNDTSYKENMVLLRDLMKDEPHRSLERAVYWTEYVLRHGGARHMRAAAANMSRAQYYEMQFILTMLSLVGASAVVVAVGIRLMWKYVMRTL